jgi:hypothetical protein
MTFSGSELLFFEEFLILSPNLHWIGVERIALHERRKIRNEKQF